MASCWTDRYEDEQVDDNKDRRSKQTDTCILFRSRPFFARSAPLINRADHNNDGLENRGYLIGIIIVGRSQLICNSPASGELVEERRERGAHDIWSAEKLN